MRLQKLRPEDYVTTQWSGGETTQLVIAPQGAAYAARDFLWRVSSATVELDESDFTALPDYRRWISTLHGDMVLAHNGGERLTLHPYEVHAFAGGDATHSWGRCRDFNLMLRRGAADGELRVLRCGGETRSFRTAARAQGMTLLFCAEGRAVIRCGGDACEVSSGESALLTAAPGARVTLEAAAPAVFLAAQAWRL